MSSCLILSGFFEKETWMHPIFPALFYACERVIRKFHENDYHSGIVRHPFSITLAPGDNYLTVHIRALGDRASKLSIL
ncbi:hypothetical protein Zm00014a_012019 [Zea mays]|uniref:FAD-binding 8 domain-containing protein n=2 Tax=Zea mays TaxID=4577 RepID=A0A8J8XKK0_MAIZE|nr:hypothetical protein ZEAMMB73_Zm00001d011640 [Zea mays]PWZ08761.1 hypothetical protein Zm00014a_012019 [Zea mays]